MDEIKTDAYTLAYDPAAHTIHWSGVVRLREAEYRPIFDLLAKAAESHPSHLTIDLRRLSFLNSGGVNVLSRFLLQLRAAQRTTLTIRAAQNHPWQRRTLPNIQRLMRGVGVELVWE